MLENGYVKLPREIVGRPWFGDGTTLKVYVFLLCGAAFKDVEREGYTVRKGQYVTSVKKLAEECQQSVQQTRTALNHLKATHDITIVTTSKFSIITVNSLVGDDDPNTFDNTLVNKPLNNRSRNKEEEIKEEYREEAAPPFSPCAEKGITVEALVERYGSAAVKRYEEKFRKWAKGKNVAKISVYPTIAKWLEQDIGEAMKRKSSIDLEEFERALMKQYGGQ